MVVKYSETIKELIQNYQLTHVQVYKKQRNENQCDIILILQTSDRQNLKEQYDLVFNISAN